MKQDFERYVSEFVFGMEISKRTKLITFSNFYENKVPALETKTQFMFLLGPQGSI